uniref:Uncharacterized protein n=1 Tax=Rhizophora mucronata TaxID=61149 RepID=A0A2P2QCY8_RHIMU
MALGLRLGFPLNPKQLQHPIAPANEKLSLNI